MAGVITTVLFILAAIHVWWVLGGVWGSAVAVSRMNGVPLFRSRAGGTLVVAGALLAAADHHAGGRGLVMLLVAQGLVQGTTWILSAVFGLRALGDFRYVGVFKRVRDTPCGVWDTWLFTPLCAALALGTVSLAARI